VEAVLKSEVLVLNRHFQPIHITSVRRAFVQLYEGIAKAVDREYRTFDFESWSTMGAAVHGSHDQLINTPRMQLRVPRVVLLVSYEKLPRTRVRFSRLNIYARDANLCQYCGRRFSRTDLNLDHVIPRSKGGLTTWENVVCSCIKCNLKKGGRTPEEAGLRLLHRPVRPKWTPTFRAPSRFYEEWRPFLSAADMAYWNTELLPA
jgi:5-methylcytosine-specific restriction endonuclease McrA